MQVAKLPDRGPDPELDELYVVGHGDQEVRHPLLKYFKFEVNSKSLVL